MSKESILKSIRINKVSGLRFKYSENPNNEESKPHYDDLYLNSEQLTKAFCFNLEAAGGVVLEWNPSDTIKSLYPNALDFTDIDIRHKYSQSTQLHILDKIECAVFESSLGVAENGAVWLEEKELPHRIIPFITQHLILKLNSSRIVATMREAYSLLDIGSTGFGVFISGPSKTADIEQSLVYGAHGAVKVTLLMSTYDL